MIIKNQIPETRNSPVRKIAYCFALYFVLSCIYLTGIAQGCQVKEISEEKFFDLCSISKSDSIKNSLSLLCGTGKCILFFSNNAPTNYLFSVVLYLDDSFRITQAKKALLESVTGKTREKMIKKKYINIFNKRSIDNDFLKNYYGCFTINPHKDLDIIFMYDQGILSGGYVSNGTEVNFDDKSFSRIMNLLIEFRNQKW